MAHKKAGGSTSYGRDSQSKRLGVKLYGGQAAKPGSIIVRQRGSKFHPGTGVKEGRDNTLFAAASGYVRFAKKKLRKFNGSLKKSTIVSVSPEK